MTKTWTKLFKHAVSHGRHSYQVYVRGTQYEFVRYGVEGEYDTVMVGYLHKATTRQEQIAHVIDDIRGLADQLQEEVDNGDYE